VAQVSFDSDQLLQQLTGDTQQAVDKLAGRSQEKSDVEARFAEIEKQMDEAAKIKDKPERDIRMKVLEADLGVLRKDADQEEKDLAQAVFGLNAMLERMGKEYANLNQPDAEGQAEIAEAEADLKEDQEQLTKAQQRRFFKQRAIANAEEEIQESQEKLEEVKTEVQRESRQRLMQADIETSLQEFMFRVEKTITIMEERKTQIEGQLRSVTLKKQQAFTVKEQAAKALEQLDQQLNEAEARLQTEEESLNALVNGTQEHAAQTQKISTSRAQVEDLRGKRNTAFVLFQSKEKFASELEVHERTQMKLRDNQRMWITALRSDTEERVVTFRSRLEAMKAMADQDIAKQLDDLGAEVDQHNVEYMARAGAVSDELRMKRMEKHPQRIADIAAARAAQAESIQRIRERELVMIKQFKEQYGIDPTASSFFHYEAEGAGDTKETV
jgi:DNA repair exonuclease SbcCD ATPase subunit